MPASKRGNNTERLLPSSGDLRLDWTDFAPTELWLTAIQAQYRSGMGATLSILETMMLITGSRTACYAPEREAKH